MPDNVQIAFHGMSPSPTAEAQIQHRVAELSQFCDRILMCRVSVEAPHQRHRHGNIYHVRVDLNVPGGRIVANREPGQNHAHEDLHVAIRDAFDAARRRLQDHMRKMEGQTKQHEQPAIGHIVRLFADRGYGFLVTEAGEEVYVHRNSVLGNGFNTLKVGDRVRYVIDPEEGEKGPQASTVVPLGASP